MERWEPILEGAYEVSDQGRVRRLAPKQGAVVGRYIAQVLSNKGYYRVNIRDANGKAITRLVHVLVAAAFIGPKPEGHDAHHKDNNKRNNDKDNLEYLSKPDHVATTVINGGYMRGTNCKWNPRKGEDNPKCKLQDTDVVAIREMADMGSSQKYLAEVFGVSRQHISWLINRQGRV